jgi:hypothetical protein
MKTYQVTITDDIRVMNIKVNNLQEQELIKELNKKIEFIKFAFKTFVNKTDKIHIECRELKGLSVGDFCSVGVFNIKNNEFDFYKLYKA